MLKKIFAILLSFSMAFSILTVAAPVAYAAGTSVYQFSIDTENTGDIIGNKVNNLNFWSLDALQTVTQPDASADCTEFIEYIQIMTATGGNSDRDLFINPDDLTVLDDYDFSKLITACHTVLQYGAKPLIKLGNVPRKLSDGYSVGLFGVNVYPPADYETYYNYISAIAQALNNEFGVDEVRTWRFGVLTEYENGDWFKSTDSSAASSCEAYCKLYDYSVAALQDVIGEDVFVGAHSMTVTEGLWDERDFIRHCALGVNYKTGATGTRLCYLSTSFYDTNPEQPTSGKTLTECIDFLRSYAESVGLTDLVYGVDEGRIHSGVNKGSSYELVSRSVGHNWQGAYDTFTLSQMVENDIDYFSSWGYTTNGAWGGIASQSFHVADCFNNLFTGTNKASVTKTYSGTSDMVSASAGWSADTDSLSVMAYNMNYSLQYSNDAAMQYTINVPSLAASTVKVTSYRIDSDCNFFDEWWTDRTAYGITDDKFNWSPDDYCIESPAVLTDSAARDIFYSQRERYKACATLTPIENYAYVSADGTLQLNDTVSANTAVFYKITPVNSATLGQTSDGSYVISSESELRLFSAMVNGGNSFEGKTVILGSDISASSSAWTPIGTSSAPFMGTFDGKGHTVSGLSLTNTSSDHLGFFGYVNGAVIRNLGITSSYFHGNIENAVLVGSCKGVTIDQCYIADSTVKSETQSAAAFIASSDGANPITVTNCWTNATVIVKPSDTSNGWAGSGFIAWVGASGPVSLRNCYYNGSLSVSPDHHGGAFFGGSSGLTKADLNNCFTTYQNIYGNPSAAYFTVSGTSATVSADDIRNNSATFGSAFSADMLGVNDGFPVLTFTLDGSIYTLNADNIYEISNEKQLRRLSYEVNHGNTYAGSVFALTNDIYMSAVPFTPIGGNGGTDNKFSGVFDGRGFFIQNLTISSATFNAGLFGFTANAEIKNLALRLPNVSGTYSVGAIVGQTYSTAIHDCCVIWGSVKTTSSGFAGGIAGRTYGVTQITDCFNLGNIILAGGNWYVGGIVGLNGESLAVTNCYNANALVAADQGVNYRGGILGGNSGGSAQIINCYAINDYPIVGSNGSNGVAQGSCNTGNADYIKSIAPTLGTAFLPDYQNLLTGYPVLKYDHTHTLNTFTEPANCTNSGRIYTVCTDCGAEISSTVLAPIGHLYTTATTAPTCTANGFTIYTCSICSDRYSEVILSTGHTVVVDEAIAPACEATGLTEGSHCTVCNEVLSAQTVIPALGHDWDNGTVTTPATCILNGVKTFTCSRCAETKTEDIIATGHTVVVDEAVAPACEAIGLTEGSHCSVCNEVLNAQTVIPALGHDWDNGTVTTPASCTSNGVKTFTCSRCTETKTEDIIATGHAVVVDEAVAPACEATGLTEGSHCSVCNEVIVAQTVIPALGHDWDNGTVTTPASCTSNGVKTFTCSRCAETKTEDIIATGHAVVVDEAVAPACEATGLTEGSHCSVCNEVIVAQTVIPALGHDWDNGTVTTPASCILNGVKTFTCSRCAETKTEDIIATGHTVVVDEAVAPACEATGLTEGSHCSVCDEVLTAQTVIPALGHDWDNGTITTPASCTSNGVKTFTCSRCAETKTEDIIATGHTVVVDEAVAPACEATGLTEGSHCSVCNEVLDAQTVISALGHDYNSVVTVPTCTADGFTMHTCTRCAESYIDSVITATGHSYTLTVTPPSCINQGYTTCTCSVCGYSMKNAETDALGHIDSDGDEKCDRCSADLSAEANCSCNCHSENAFIRFFWKIKVFFQKLFGMENKRICNCGKEHW